MSATPTPMDNTNNPSMDSRSKHRGRRGVGRHARRESPSAYVSSDIQSNEDKSKISLLGIPEGDVEITGGHFNGVGGNQFSLHLNLNGRQSERCQRCNNVSIASDEGDINYDGNPDVEMVGSQALPSDCMRDSVTIPEDSDRSTSEGGVQQVSEEPYTIYFRSLATRERGSPLWIPEPNKQLSVEYQRNGLVIGDVGIITNQGCFDSLFNLSLPPDHPLAINTDDLPQNFSPLVIKPGHILKSSKFKKGASLSTGSVSVTIDESSGLTFESSASEGAILTLPDGSNSEDLRNKKKLRDYLSVHLEEIYRCVLIEHGREINNGDLRVVTGFDKTSTWGMAAFSNPTSQRNPSFRLEFRARNQGCVGQTHSWKSSGIAEVKTGPDTKEVVALRMGDPSQQDLEYENQAVFVRCETLTLHPDIWNALVSESCTREVEHEGDLDTYPDFHPEVKGSSPGSSFSGGSTGGTSGQSANRGSWSNNSCSLDTLAIHPSNGINDLLLKLNPSARMAVTGDEVWISVLKEDDTLLPPTETLWARIMELYDVRIENAVVFFEVSEAEVSPIHIEPTTDSVELSSLGRELNTNPSEESRSKSRIQTDKVVSAEVHHGSPSFERIDHNSIYESLARITQQVVAPTGVYVGPQLSSSQPRDLPSGLMSPNIEGAIKSGFNTQRGLPKGLKKSTVEGLSKPPIQTHSNSGQPPLDNELAPNTYHQNPSGYHSSHPPSVYPAPASQTSQTPTTYLYPGRVPRPSHRHASPSAPWPWVDLDDEVDRRQLECPLLLMPSCDHKPCGGCWTGYPQTQFPTWTERQIKKSKILDAINNYSKETTCICHQLDVDTNGVFTNPGPIVAKPGEEEFTWNQLITEKRRNGLRVRALFLENTSGPMLQMLGTKYNIEPFFWSSSLNWIPSRFQEEAKPGIGDHITITLTFVRSMSNHDATLPGHGLGKSTETLRPTGTLLGTQKTDPCSPLVLHSNNRILVLDLLAVHLIRNINGSTIISFHPTLDIPTTAAFLHERIRSAGQSMYWQSMFQKHGDPTFVLLTFVWYAMYAWDEALENLYDHICNLESRVITTEDMPLTQELHVLRAHHLHYTSLLDDYSKHVHFIRDTHNPAMDAAQFSEEDRTSSRIIMARECANLTTEIARLKGELHMQEGRLKNINDSRNMRVMTEAAVRDSAAMKQVAYLTMVFLPASFVASVFRMNESEINPGISGTISVYLAITSLLTIVTAWIVIAFQNTYIFPENTGFIQRLGWPIYLLMTTVQKRQQQRGNTETDSFTYNISSAKDSVMRKEIPV